MSTDIDKIQQVVLKSPPAGYLWEWDDSSKKTQSYFVESDEVSFDVYIKYLLDQRAKQ